MNTDLLLCKAKNVKGEWSTGHVAKMPSNWTIYRPRYDSDGVFKGVSPIGIYPDTICRCTGKKDSNGRLVFEGDWFVDGYGVEITIAWNDATCEFVGIGDPVDGKLNIDEWNFINETIRGNIYDENSRYKDDPSD